MTQQVILIVDNLLITQAVMTGIPPSNKDDSKKRTQPSTLLLLQSVLENHRFNLNLYVVKTLHLHIMPSLKIIFTQSATGK